MDGGDHNKCLFQYDLKNFPIVLKSVTHNIVHTIIMVLPYYIIFKDSINSILTHQTVSQKQDGQDCLPYNMLTKIQIFL